MFIITGDVHCPIDIVKLNNAMLPNTTYTKDDYLIITGDAGFVWNGSNEEKYWQNWIKEKSFTTLFVDGNHENFDILNSLPVEIWNGGKVHKVNDSLIHLMRGQVFTIHGKKFFTMGGAPSHDIQDGVLDPKAKGFRQKKRELDKRNAFYRILHHDWWPEEMPSQEEYDEGIQNLAAHNNKVDYILTHEAPFSLVGRITRTIRTIPISNPLSLYLDRIQSTVKYQHWYFGHYHNNWRLDEHHTLLFNNKAFIPTNGDVIYEIVDIIDKDSLSTRKDQRYPLMIGCKVTNVRYLKGRELVFEYITASDGTRNIGKQYEKDVEAADLSELSSNNIMKITTSDSIFIFKKIIHQEETNESKQI